jgi:quinol monooxygenase YgiN
MIIVAGRLGIRAGARETFLALSSEAIVQARRTLGCHDFVVAADPLDPDRVNVYEAWESREALDKFRADGPGDELSAYILSAQIEEYTVHC